MKVIKRNGKEQELSFDKILYRIKKVSGKCSQNSLEDLVNVDHCLIAQEVIANIFDGISTSQLDEIAARISVSYSTVDTDYAELAARLCVSNLHKKTTECYSEVSRELHEKGLISDETFEIVEKNKDTLNNSIDYSRDYLFDYFGLKTLERSYLLKEGDTGEIIERPQNMWLRVAVGIHKHDIPRVIETYNLMSQFYFTHASPTLFNAGTNRPALSSCYLTAISDSMLGIYKTLSDCAMISKHAGGIGLHVSNIRSSGSYIKGTNGKSDGIVKMLKVFNETARFANQGSKRNGSFAVYLEPHHADIQEFLELRKNTGDESLRARDLFYAMWVSDYFMECVENNGDWYLMSEDTNPGLTDSYGEEYKQLYLSYVESGNYRQKIKARDLWQKILVSQIETGMPYMSYKDAVNEKSNQKNIGVIKSSNLCVAPETKILTSYGYLRIDALVGRDDIEVWNGSQFSRCSVFKTSDESELVKVSFSDGAFLECTKYHKFHLKDGRVVCASELLSGEILKNCDFPVLFVEKDNTLRDKLNWISTNFSENIESGELVIGLEKGFSKSELLEIKLMLQTIGINVAVDFSGSDRITIGARYIPYLCRLGFLPKNISISGVFEIKELEVSVVSVEETGRISKTYCFNEPLRHTGVLNGVLTGNCNEITLVSNEEEIAVCNICTFSLPKYVEKNSDGTFYYNHEKLSEIVRIATRNMNNVIDYNYYPVPETRTSNMRHRPIAMGIQGLANVFFEMKIPFDSEEAKTLNKEIMETVQYSGWKASMELAKELGEPYSSFVGSPASKGVFQHNMWGIKNSETSGRWDWDSLRSEIVVHGVRNSMITALPPTASTSQILGNYESFEPQNSNMFMRSTLSGDFPIINRYLVKDLAKLGLWSEDMKNAIIANQGSVQNIEEIPDWIKKVYKTIWEISQKTLLEMSRDRGLFVDQTQSLNVYMTKPSIAKLSSMHMYGWKIGLKTGLYYLRTKSASNAQQFTVSKKQVKEEIVCSLDNRDACLACSG